MRHSVLEVEKPPLLTALAARIDVRAAELVAFGNCSPHRDRHVAGLLRWPVFLALVRRTALGIRFSRCSDTKQWVTMKKENGVEVDAPVREACVSKMERTPSEGLIFYADRSKCVIAAKSPDSAAKCGAESTN